MARQQARSLQRKSAPLKKSATPSHEHSTARAPLGVHPNLLRSALLDPRAARPAAVVRLQRMYGNGAVARASLGLQRQEAASKEAEESERANEEAVGAEEGFDSGDDAKGVSDAELLEDPDVKSIFDVKEPVTLAGETHTLFYELDEGELELGVATKWTNLSLINTRIRQRIIPVSATYKAAWSSVGFNKKRLIGDKKKLSKKQDEIDTFTQPYTGGVRMSTRSLLGVMNKAHRERLLKLQQQYERIRRTVDSDSASYVRACNAFINTAFDEYGPTVGDILAGLAPTHIAAPHATLNVAANTHRYHEGTAADPIPIIWYKPRNQYPTLTVNAYNAAGVQQNFNLAYPDGGTVFDGPPGGNRKQYTFGVHANNRVPGKVSANAYDLRNVKNVITRTRQQELNQIIAGLGFNMNNRDGDHVRDLGFEGTDTDDNFWPLPRDVNQRALIWRRAYRFHFKEASGGGWRLRSATIDGLPGKYFRIKGEENVNIPTESATAAAGSDTNYGAARNIDVNGTNVQEA